MTWQVFHSKKYGDYPIEVFTERDGEYIRVYDEANSYSLICHKDDLKNFWIMFNYPKIFVAVCGIQFCGSSNISLRTHHASKYFKFKYDYSSNNIKVKRIKYVLEEIKKINDVKKYFKYNDNKFDTKNILNSVGVDGLIQIKMSMRDRTK